MVSSWLLPYHVYPGVEWSTDEQLGRFTISPDQVALEVGHRKVAEARPTGQALQLLIQVEVLEFPAVRGDELHALFVAIHDPVSANEAPRPGNRIAAKVSDVLARTR